MPWTLFILVTVFFSVICGNRMLDSPQRRSYVASRNAGALLSDTSNVRKCVERAADGGSALQQEAAVRHFYGLDTAYGMDDSKFLSSLYDRNDCLGADTLTVAAESADYPERIHASSEKKRNKNAQELRKLDTNVDLLSGILTLDAHSLEAGQAGSTAVRNEAAIAMPPSYSAEFYEDLLSDAKNEDVKRAGTAPAIGCDCKIKNDLLDLGQQHFPRYLLNAVCQFENEYNNEYQQKCWRGSYCKPLEYKVKVLTFRLDPSQKDTTLAWLPDDLRQLWKFKTVTVAAGCFCSY